MDSLRISDADREAALDVLAEHYATGRLTKDEFDERSDAVWSAKTRGDLAPLFADLPMRSPGLPASGAQRGPRRRPGFRFALVPVLLLLVAVVVITKAPFLLLFALLWFCFAPRHGRAHCGSRPRQDWAGRRTVG